MKGELVRIKTKDGLELHGLLCEPGNTDKVLIHVHSWIGNFYENRFLDFIADEINNKGIAFLTFNNRGAGIITEFIKNGKYERIGGSLEKFEECIIDIKAAINFLNKKGYKDIILQGHSLSCQKITYYKYKTKDKCVKALVLLEPVDDANCAKGMLGKRYNESLKIAKDLLKKKKKVVPEWMRFYPLLTPERFLQVSDPESTCGRIFDFSGELKEIKNVNCPVLAIFGSKDDYQKNPEKALEILKNKAKCDIKLIKNGNHWLKGHESELGKVITDWIGDL